MPSAMGLTGPWALLAERGDCVPTLAGREEALNLPGKRRKRCFYPGGKDKAPSFPGCRRGILCLPWQGGTGPWALLVERVHLALALVEMDGIWALLADGGVHVPVPTERDVAPDLAKGGNTTPSPGRRDGALDYPDGWRGPHTCLGGKGWGLGPS